MNEDQTVFFRLTVALAIGLIIGIERGWHRREAREGERVAGLRTYGLVGLLGGTAVLLAETVGPIVLAFTFLSLAAVMLGAYFIRARQVQDVGTTSFIAVLLTCVLGGLAVAGHEGVAAAAAVVATLLLNYKSQLHQWISALRAEELRAGLQLLLISVVALPILPNYGFGPWQALNPHTIWLMVVLIAAISFTGYVAVRIAGVRKGILFTSVSGGLASSTAITLHFSRLARADSSMTPLLAVGVLLACGTMFPRLLLITTLLNPALFPVALPVTAIMAFIVYAWALALWRSLKTRALQIEAPLKNPLELRVAISFGLLLAVIMLLGAALQDWFGDTGLLALALASGITDVDAIAVSLSRMSVEQLSTSMAIKAIIFAAAVNSVTKAGMATVIGGRSMGLRVGIPLALAALAGILFVQLSAQ